MREDDFAQLARIAQLVEQLICNQKVEGSIPSVSTRIPEGQGVRGEPLYKSADLYVGH